MISLLHIIIADPILQLTHDIYDLVYHPNRCEWYD